MTDTMQLEKVAQSAGIITTAIGKFMQAGSDEAADEEKALYTMSGILDVSSAVATFLPPPASIVVDTFTSLLNVFMPGAADPSTQAH